MSVSCCQFNSAILISFFLCVCVCVCARDLSFAKRWKPPLLGQQRVDAYQVQVHFDFPESEETGAAIFFTFGEGQEPVLSPFLLQEGYQPPSLQESPDSTYCVGIFPCVFRSTDHHTPRTGRLVLHSTSPTPPWLGSILTRNSSTPAPFPFQVCHEYLIIISPLGLPMRFAQGLKSNADFVDSVLRLSGVY